MNPTRLDQAGMNMLCQLEGYKSHPYLDSNNIWTIGCGTTILPNRLPVMISTKPITKEIALQYVENYLIQIYAWITNNCKWQMTQGQFNCIVSFLYNLGLGTHLNNCSHTKQAIITGDKPNIIIGMKSVNNNGLLSNRREKEIAMFMKV